MKLSITLSQVTEAVRIGETMSEWDGKGMPATNELLPYFRAGMVAEELGAHLEENVEEALRRCMVRVPQTVGEMGAYLGGLWCAQRVQDDDFTFDEGEEDLSPRGC